jgi:hypothetical protein
MSNLESILGGRVPVRFGFGKPAVSPAVSRMIRLRFRSLALEVEAFHYAGVGERMMAARNARSESLCLEQKKKLLEADVGV